MKSFVDDGGAFYPLTASLFWGLGAWMKGGSEQARVRENFDFLASYGIEAVRTFYYVDWTRQPYGGLIAGTPAALAEYLDAAQHYGLRVKLTVQAGAPNPTALAHDVVSVVVTRPSSILLLEGTNEGWASYEDGVAVGRILATAGVPSAVGFGNQGLDTIIRMGNEAGTSVDVVHLERTPPAARQDRQCWDCHLLPRAGDNGEFVGPASSVATQDDPRHLAIERAGGIICGAESYCYHSGDGVYGVTYDSSAGRRYANLFDRPGIADILRSLRLVDLAIAYTGIGNWRHTNNPIPMEFQQHLDKQYFAINEPSFIAILTGVTGPLGPPKFNRPVASWQLYVPWTGDPTTPDALLPGYVLRGTLA